MSHSNPPYFPPSAPPLPPQQPYSQPPPHHPPYATPSSQPAYAYPYPAYQTSGYPPYAPSHSLFPPGTDPDIVAAFQAADIDGSGRIDEYELQKAVATAYPFDIRTVRLMIHLFNAKDSPKLGPTEFIHLWKALKDWKGIFQRFDRDHSGTIDRGEMRDALLSLGYALSHPILDSLLQIYDRTGQAKAMDYDSFVQCGLIVKGLTEKFKEQDTQLKGYATLSYEKFMLMVLPFIVA